MNTRAKPISCPQQTFLTGPLPNSSGEDEVVITAKGIAARVVDVCWHFNEQRYYYYLEDAQGRTIKKRYFGDELVRA